MNIFFKIFYPVILFFLLSCSMDEPVSDDYFSNIDRVKGKNAPTVPAITAITSCSNAITLDFTGSTDPDGDDITYVIYFSFTDTSSFSNDDFYDPRRIAGLSSEDGGTVDFTTSYEGVIFFWITAYDGGRESDYSNVVSVTVPGQDCP